MFIYFQLFPIYLHNLFLISCRQSLYRHGKPWALVLLVDNLSQFRYIGKLLMHDLPFFLLLEPFGLFLFCYKVKTTEDNAGDDSKDKEHWQFYLILGLALFICPAFLLIYATSGAACGLNTKFINGAFCLIVGTRVFFCAASEGA